MSSGIYWLGITDLAIEGDYIYASDSSYLNSTYWHATEPTGKPSENCVVMRDTYLGHWDDVQCSIEAGFVCENLDTCKWVNSVVNDRGSASLCVFYSVELT